MIILQKIDMYTEPVPINCALTRTVLEQALLVPSKYFSVKGVVSGLLFQDCIGYTFSLIGIVLGPA
jgi:hypothetical protein